MWWFGDSGFFLFFLALYTHVFSCSAIINFFVYIILFEGCFCQVMLFEIADG